MSSPGLRLPLDLQMMPVAGAYKPRATVTTTCLAEVKAWELVHFSGDLEQKING